MALGSATDGECNPSELLNELRILEKPGSLSEAVDSVTEVATLEEVAVAVSCDEEKEADVSSDCSELSTLDFSGSKVEWPCKELIKLDLDCCSNLADVDWVNKELITLGRDPEVCCPKEADVSSD